MERMIKVEGRILLIIRWMNGWDELVGVVKEIVMWLKSIKS